MKHYHVVNDMVPATKDFSYTKLNQAKAFYYSGIAAAYETDLNVVFISDTEYNVYPDSKVWMCNMKFIECEKPECNLGGSPPCICGRHHDMPPHVEAVMGIISEILNK